MKKIYTSNFARHSNNKKAIAISLSVPEWYDGKWFKYLAPKTDMVGKIKKSSANYNQRKYTRDYLDVLKARNVSPHALVDVIEDGTILLCYEPPGAFCHRRILAEWIERHTGVVVLEWKTQDEKNEEKQHKLVDSIFDF